MKILVDEMPKTPDECIFSSPGKSAIGNILYRCELRDKHNLCGLNHYGGCKYLQRGSRTKGKIDDQRG